MEGKVTIKIKQHEAFIFDMDGLLIDTERICWECFRKACSEFSYEPDFEIYKKCIGRKPEEGNLILKQGFDPFIPFDDVHSKWNEFYHNYVDHEIIPLKSGVYSALNLLHRNDASLAVATSTERKLALKKLTRTGLIGFFDLVVTGDQVKYSKPDPEIYLTVAERLNVRPMKCVAFEDSDSGVRSAYTAGMRVIQIIDLIQPADEIRKLNHTIIKSFDDVSFE